MSFRQIQEATGVPKSTASDIWRHAVSNARRAKLLTTTTTATTSTTTTSMVNTVTTTPVSTSLNTTSTTNTINTTNTITTATSACTTQDPIIAIENYDIEFSLLDLINSAALDPDARSGHPKVLGEVEIDRLVEFVKRDFVTRRMGLRDIQRESGFSHVSDTIIFKALSQRGIHAYREIFKFILNADNKLKRLTLENEWANYAFTNEMSIEIGGLFGPSTVWREKGEKWLDDCVGAKKKRGLSVMCWGMISWDWKGPFWVWEPETEEEKAKAMEEIKEYNRNCKEEEKRLNDIWRSSEEWRELKAKELKIQREARAIGRRTGVKTKTTQSWRGKKFKVKSLKRGDTRG
ncbi:hypothetical protein L873DRAFT_1812348, partial [Choiromyces venosus 120613-1]